MRSACGVTRIEHIIDILETCGSRCGTERICCFMYRIMDKILLYITTLAC